MGESEKNKKGECSKKEAEKSKKEVVKTKKEDNKLKKKAEKNKKEEEKIKKDDKNKKEGESSKQGAVCNQALETNKQAETSKKEQETSKKGTEATPKVVEEIVESPLESALRELKTSLLEFDVEGKRIHRLSCIERIKCKQSWKRGIPQKSKKHAQNVIKHANTYNNYAKLSSRLERVINYIENAIKNGKVKSNTEQFMRNMLSFLENKELKQAEKIMEKFEREIEGLKLKNAFRPIDTVAVSINELPVHDVDTVMKEVIDEINEEMRDKNYGASTSDQADDDEEEVETFKMIANLSRDHD